MTEGLTEGGQWLLDSILKGDTYSVSCMFVINKFLEDQAEAARLWTTTDGVHFADAKHGVTLEDYKLIKSMLMVMDKWIYYGRKLD